MYYSINRWAYIREREKHTLPDCSLLGHVHLVSIDIESEHFTLLKETVIRSHYVYVELHVLCRRNFISSLVNCEGCGF